MANFANLALFHTYLTHRQLDWSTMMFIESPFLGYPTCLIFDHVVWWSTVLWTATPWLFRFPKEIFLYLNVSAECMLFNSVVQRRYFPLCCRLYFLQIRPRRIEQALLFIIPYLAISASTRLVGW